MRQIPFYCAAALLLASFTARADTFNFSFGGGGVSGTVALTYGSGTDAKYPSAYKVTGISGTFSDSNVGIANASITGLESINHATPEPTNLLAPDDFSRFAVAMGTDHGSLNFDNLLWPGGSPQSATDYPFHGGFLDIYGLVFDISGGQVVNLWSNGVLPGTSSVDYGAAVATSAQALDYVGNGVTVTPEPGTWCLVGTGLLAMAFWRRLA